ncbi:MAG: cation:proton antiporter [Cyclobacteriaceae bacterium]|nr:cation:proton antiporter [Cyclobacteriaceae bacterium]
MNIAIIITICTLLLIAYVFSITAPRTRIPSVILLLLLGWIVRQAADFLELDIPRLTPLLPILGTIGLVLIVLEGSLELELDKSKTPIIKRSFLVALIPILVLGIALAYLFQHVSGASLRVSLINAIPLCVISSAIAIPSAKNLSPANREFSVYESTLSDILGVLFFNFMALNTVINLSAFLHFGLQLVIMILVSFVATIGLSYLLSRIDHHVKHTPIILLLILIFAVSEVYHLPALIFIVIFGLFIGNFDQLKRFRWAQQFRAEALDKEVNKFKEITMEAAFVVRALFFLLFGYLIETAEILNPETSVWAVGIVVLIFLIRALQLKVYGLKLRPLVFLAPRGLITILLFFTIPVGSTIPVMNKSLIMQVIVLSALVMMVGMMTTRTEKPEEKSLIEEKEETKVTEVPYSETSS